MIKKLMISTLVLATTTAAPAYAINHKYAQQLDFSGCTQVNAGVTCDVNKSKAWNQKHTYHAPTPKPLAPVSKYIVAEANGIKSMTMPQAEKYLTTYGWTKMSGSKYVWEKGNNNMDYVLTNGIVSSVTVR